MRIATHQLKNHLSKGLLPVYLVSGDEPLQMGETTDCIRLQARDNGYTGREILEVDSSFDWSELMNSANSLSLFAEQRIIDLRIPTGKPGGPGGSALTEYAANPPQDTLLLITLPKLDRTQHNSKWFRALDKVGASVQVWPVEGNRLPAWIEQRMQSVGLTPSPDVVPMLAERIEGNLLAAQQEIEKLLLLNGPGLVSPERLAESVADSARYDVFGLVDSALQGRVGRCVKMLNGLKAEGTPAPVVLWALTRELRLLTSLAGEVKRGRNPRQVVAARREIWEKRKPLVAKGLGRMDAPGWQRLLRLCGETDRAIKGRDRRNPWLLMQDIVTRMAGAPDVSTPELN